MRYRRNESQTKTLYMNKIIHAALSALYPKATIDQLVEIIHETPNPVMATEMLLGIYESPKLAVRVTDGKTEFTLVNIDEWRNQVYYSVLAEERVGSYFPKGTRQEDLTVDNFKTFQVEGKEEVYLSFPTGKVKTQKSTMSIEKWKTMTPVEDSL